MLLVYLPAYYYSWHRSFILSPSLSLNTYFRDTFFLSDYKIPGYQELKWCKDLLLGICQTNTSQILRFISPLCPWVIDKRREKSVVPLSVKAIPNNKFLTIAKYENPVLLRADFPKVYNDLSIKFSCNFNSEFILTVP